MKKIKLLIFSAILILSLAACGNNPPADQNAGLPKQETPEETPEEVTPEKIDFTGRTLNVVTTSADYVPLFEKFTAETGAKVEFLSMSSGEVISRIKAEGGNPMADLWFGGGIDAFMQAKTDGILEQHFSPEAETVPAEYKDADGYWLSKGITVVGFMVNPAILESKNLEVPKSWSDLAKPEYKDEIIMSNPLISGTNYAVVKGLIDLYGEEEAWNYFSKLNANIPFYGKRGGDPQEKVTAGEFGIGIIPVSKGPFDVAKENGFEIIWPEEGIPWVPEGVAIFKNSKGADVAKAFVDFMLKDENQELLSELDGKDGAQMIKPGIKGYETGLPKDKLIVQDLSTFGTLREEILNKWQELTKDKES